MQTNQTKKILIGFTGSVASIKYQELIDQIQQQFQGKIEIRVVLTARSQKFIKDLQLKSYSDNDEWDQWQQRGDPVLHIDLRKWADLFLIAPLSANTMAKMANGLCDNLLTCIVRAWDYSKPLIVAPAMNTLMYTNPFTEKHLKILKEMGVYVIEPIVKTLMCQESGIGAMEEVGKIAIYVETDHFVKESEEQDNLETIVGREQEITERLRRVLGAKEIQHKQLIMERRTLLDQVWEKKMQSFEGICSVDPFLLKYMSNMEEQLGEFDLSAEVPEASPEKIEKIAELHKFANLQQGPLKLLRTQTEIACHLQIAYKNMMEGLNQELFEHMQERADLEDQQFEFDKKLKGLRQQIREMTERNQKLIKQIENNKSGE